MIQPRVASPHDITGVLVPLLRSEPAVMNLTVLRSAVSGPDVEALHVDVLLGAADQVIGRLATSMWNSEARSCWRTSTGRARGTTHWRLMT